MESGNAKTLLDLSDGIQNLIRLSPNRPIAEMNFIEYFNPCEPDTSCLLEMLFSYKNDKGKYQIFESFAEMFLVPVGFNSSEISHPEIHREEKHIDLWIIERGKYAIIFENKLKGACFQRNQLARYVQTMRNMNFTYDQIFLVLLPMDTSLTIDRIPRSVWCLPPDGLNATNGNRICKGNDSTSCWCDNCDKTLNDKEKAHCSKCNKAIKKIIFPHTIILGKELSQWMINLETKIESRERNVRSALLQFADYLDFLYNNRLNKLMEMEIDQYVANQLNPSMDKEGWKSLRKKLMELDELKNSIERIKRDISRNLIDKWYDVLKEKWPEMEYVPHESFGFIIDKNIWVGCRFFYENENNVDAGDDDQPFWGFKRIDDRNASKRQRSLVELILSHTDGLKAKWDDDAYIAWNNTLNGDIRCDQIFTSAKELGYL